MTRPRRFRDMSLTEDEAERAALAYWPGPSLDRTQGYDAFICRAKRLLPLWRDIGLKRLKNEGRSEGYVCGVDDARFGRF